MIPFLDLKAVNTLHREELLEAIAEVIDSGWYILGEKVKLFENLFADYIFVSSGVEVISFVTLQDEISDHLPLVLEFGVVK